MPTSRLACSIGVVDNNILVLGGFNQNSMSMENEMYDPVTGRRFIKSPMADIRHTFFAGVIQDTIYLAGGLIPTRKIPAMPSYLFLYMAIMSKLNKEIHWKFHVNRIGVNEK